MKTWKGKKTAADFPEPTVEVWDENYDCLMWFRSVLSQFKRVGMEGVAVGFDYNVAHREFDDMELRGHKRDEWKWKLKIMEAAALPLINRPG